MPVFYQQCQLIAVYTNVPRLDEHNHFLTDGELVLWLKSVINRVLKLFQKVLKEASLVLVLENGDNAGISRLQMRRGVWVEKANLCSKFKYRPHLFFC